jgi:hypothetical protein
MRRRAPPATAGLGRGDAAIGEPPSGRGAIRRDVDDRRRLLAALLMRRAIAPSRSSACPNRRDRHPGPDGDALGIDGRPSGSRLESGNEMLEVVRRDRQPDRPGAARAPDPRRAEGRAERTVYSWSIAPPVRELQPRGRVAFDSAEIGRAAQRPQPDPELRPYFLSTPRQPGELEQPGADHARGGGPGEADRPPAVADEQPAEPAHHHEEAEDVDESGPDLVAERAQGCEEDILEPVEDDDAGDDGEHRGGEGDDPGIVGKGHDRDPRAGHEQDRKRAEHKDGEAAGDQGARPGLVALARPHRIADPDPGRRAQAHRQGEGEIVDRQHRLEARRRRSPKLGRQRHQPGEAGQLEVRGDAGTSPNQASAARRRARGDAAADQSRTPRSRRAAASSKSRDQHAPPAETRRGGAGRADRAQRGQAEMAADPGPGEQAVDGSMTRLTAITRRGRLIPRGSRRRRRGRTGPERRAPSPGPPPRPARRRLGDADQAQQRLGPEEQDDHRRRAEAEPRRGPSGKMSPVSASRPAAVGARGEDQHAGEPRSPRRCE